VTSTETTAAVTPGEHGLRAWTRSVGPGLVFVLTVLGPGDIVSNAATGATYGYSLIWALALTVLFRYVWVSTSAKYVLVTGESLLQGYRRVGKSTVWIVFFATIVARHLSNLYKVLLMGTAVDLLLPLPTPWSASLWSIFFTMVGFAMMFRGGYPGVERCCKFLIGVMGLSLVASALLSRPEPAGALRGALIPTLPANQGAYSVILVLTALIGTQAGTLSNVSYAYFIRERGWKDISSLRLQRRDLLFGVGCPFVMGALLQVASASTVGSQGGRLEGIDDLVRIFTETQGTAGRIIFALGLWSLAFSGFIGGTMGYALIVSDIWRRFIRQTTAGPDDEAEESRRDPVYRWAVVLFSVSPLYILFTGVSPVWLVLVVRSLVVVLIPLLAFALLRITNDASLMGKHKNGWLTNLVLVLLIVTSAWLTARNIVDSSGWTR
jgi:Mn2+/Fe2+ NRAMP family transporter